MLIRQLRLSWTGNLSSSRVEQLRIRDLVMELCCALHNFRVRLGPWQQMNKDLRSKLREGQQGSRPEARSKLRGIYPEIDLIGINSIIYVWSLYLEDTCRRSPSWLGRPQPHQNFSR